MKRTVLHLELATPAFLGGASPQAADALAEWRASSIRGQWRWWFRALAGPVFGSEPRAVAAAESRVFGSTGASSLLQVRAEHSEIEVYPVGARLPELPRRHAADLASAWEVHPRHPDRAATVQRLILRPANEIPTNTIAYLAYGCLSSRGELTRSAIAPGAQVRIVLQWREARWASVSAEAQRLAGAALQAWLLLGGIGSKCRKGFGSLRLSRVDGMLPDGFPALAPASTEERLRDAIATLPGAEAAPAPSWTQLSRASRLHLGRPAPSWQEALDRVGGWLIAFRRRYGIDAEERNGLAGRDYEWHKGRGGGIPDRAGFGLPLPFGEHGPVAEARDPADSTRSLRRASPLLVHVERLGERSYLPVLSHLDGPFLPDGVEIAFNGGRVRATPSSPTPRQLDVVGRFLDDLVTKKLVTRVGRPAP